MPPTRHLAILLTLAAGAVLFVSLSGAPARVYVLELSLAAPALYLGAWLLGERWRLGRRRLVAASAVVVAAAILRTLLVGTVVVKAYPTWKLFAANLLLFAVAVAGVWIASGWFDRGLEAIFGKPPRTPPPTRADPDVLYPVTLTYPDGGQEVFDDEDHLVTNLEEFDSDPTLSPAGRTRVMDQQGREYRLRIDRLEITWFEPLDLHNGQPRDRSKPAVVTLRPDERQLLAEVLRRRRPRLLPAVDELGRVPLTPERREELRALLVDELTERELEAGDEPTPRGRRLDDLIGRLAEL